MKDYYKILGVSQNCTKEDLKKAYRELVLRYHPDKNPNNSQYYSDKFKEIQEAFEFLIKNQKKFEFRRSDIDDVFDDLFSKFFGDQKDKSSKIRIKISFEESYKGCSKILEIDKYESCGVCKGTGGYLLENCEKCRGGIVGNSTCVNCVGKGYNIKIKCDNCLGQGFSNKYKEKIIIDIPPGIEDNAQIRMANKASDGGDLYVIIMVQKDSNLIRESQNIIYNLDVPYSKLVLGGYINFKLFEQPLKIKIKPRTKPGSKIIIKNHGFSLINNMSRGDLVCNVLLKLPKEITKEYKEIIEKLSNFDDA